MISATYQVTGMTCEHCVRAVTEELARLDGVREVSVELVPEGSSAVTVTSDGPLPARRGRGRPGRGRGLPAGRADAPGVRTRNGTRRE